MSGYDLDLPEGEQRQGRKFSHVGHGGIDLPAPRGTEVHLAALEHQEGDAEVLFAGKLFGTTVITRHTLREGGRLRDYVVLHGHLDGVAAWARARSGTDARRRSSATWATRGARASCTCTSKSAAFATESISRKTPPERLIANEISVVCDPRNVLPLK